MNREGRKKEKEARDGRRTEEDRQEYTGGMRGVDSDEPPSITLSLNFTRFKHGIKALK